MKVLERDWSVNFISTLNINFWLRHTFCTHILYTNFQTFKFKLVLFSGLKYDNTVKKCKIRHFGHKHSQNRNLLFLVSKF